jgi:predicted N-formylglutamate amidohydrolase
MTSDVTGDSGSSLLDPTQDPDPVTVVAATRRSDVLLVCEHAGRAVPARLQRLGLPDWALSRHIAYDIGAEAVARRLAARLGCGLLVQNYSRLVVDCNRPPLSAQSIPAVSDGVEIPGNRGLTASDRQDRVDAIFTPYARACESHITAEGLRAAFSIHSFTPTMQGTARPWQIGFCDRAPRGCGNALAAGFRDKHPDVCVGRNQPYGIDDDSDWFIPQCAEPRGVWHALVEIRNDTLAREADCDRWADQLAELFTEILERDHDADP